jgi:hypothetical protein
MIEDEDDDEDDDDIRYAPCAMRKALKTGEALITGIKY